MPTSPNRHHAPHFGAKGRRVCNSRLVRIAGVVAVGAAAGERFIQHQRVPQVDQRRSKLLSRPRADRFGDGAV
jgi:hypothetical protein